MLIFFIDFGSTNGAASLEKDGDDQKKLHENQFVCNNFLTRAI